MKLQKSLGLIGLALVSALSVITPAAAASVPTLYAQPAELKASKDDQLSVNLRINPNGASLDTINVVVKYPADSLNYSGLSTTGSGFSAFVPSKPKADNGTITFAAAKLTGGVVDSDTAVATLNFTVTNISSAAQVKFDGSQAALNGNVVAISSDPATVTFDNSAYTVKLTITDSNGDPLAGARVTVGDLSSVTTNSDGVVTVSNVGAGNQKVAVNDAKPQMISVKSGASNSEAQPFTLTAHASDSPWLKGVAVIILGLIAVVAFEVVHIYRRRTRANS